MAVTRRSAALTDLLAVPKSLQRVSSFGGRVRSQSDSIALVAADVDTVGDSVLLGRLPSSAVIHALYLMPDDFGTTYTCDVGLFVKDTGTIIDQDIIAAGVDLAAVVSPNIPLNVWAGAQGGVQLTRWGQSLWELLGLSSNPAAEYDWGITTVTQAAIAANIDLSWAIFYSID